MYLLNEKNVIHFVQRRKAPEIFFC